MKLIKEKIKENKKIYKIIQSLRLLQSGLIFQETGLKKKYPKVIQFPITNFCNSKCIMCNIPSIQLRKGKKIEIEELKEILEDKLFKEVEAVGINGGEPFLKNNLYEIVDLILDLPKIKTLNIISNGFNTNMILEKLKEIKRKCEKKNVLFHVSFSLDGYGEVHNKVRGMNNVFEKTIKTIKAIKSSKLEYCDSYDVGCTIVRQNIYYVNQLKEYCKMEEIPIKFRLGIKNKRIESEEKYEKFSIFEDLKLKQTAAEIFYTLYSEEQNIISKYKYWSIYNFLTSKNPKRALGCLWKERGVTLDGQGKLYYCAVESEELSKNGENLKSIFFSDENLKYRETLIKNKCEKCIHDYTGNPKIQDILRFFKYYIKEDREWGKGYKKELK